MQEKNLIQALLGLAFSLAFSVALLPGCSGSSADNGAAVDPSSLTINAMARPEGGPGEGSVLRFRATLTRPQPQAVTVRYATSAITATAEEDYRDTSGELIIPAGALEGFIEVELVGDLEVEENETFLLSFESSKNAIATADTANGTIGNDDGSCDVAFDNLPNPWLVNGDDPLNFAHRGGVGLSRKHPLRLFPGGTGRGRRGGVSGLVERGAADDGQCGHVDDFYGAGWNAERDNEGEGGRRLL